MSKIKFGTDGWRAVIADQFTYDNIKIVAQAWSDFINETDPKPKGIAVSYDTRFLSDQFARTIAEVIASNDIPVYLSTRFTPTPVLSFSVKNKKLAGGVMVTASHNPYFYNGIKFKDTYGGPILSETTNQLSKKLYKNSPIIDKVLIKKNLNEVNFLVDYKNQIKKYINFDLVNELEGLILIDPMHGAGIGIINQFLTDSKLTINNLNDQPNPLFNNKHPEPIPENLKDLKQAIISKKALLGIATDGDADRFGILDYGGKFVQLHDLMPLLFEYMVKSRDWDGNVVRTTSMANTIDKVATKYGRNVSEVPVGFKNVTEVMLNEDILIGGEESGGFGFKNHIPERDGILSALLILELQAHYKTTISELVKDLRKNFGPFAYGRVDRYSKYELLQSNMQKLQRSNLKTVLNYNITSTNLNDGIKLYFDNQSWMLIRVSQTEPLARIYVGSTKQSIVQKLLDAGVKLITGKQDS